MIILSIRTDKPESEVGLFQDDLELAYVIWPAHRMLAETLHTKIHDLLHSQQKDWHDIQGIIAYEGPGSFTGLRIGLSVANALAGGLGIPITAASGDDWRQKATQQLIAGSDARQVVPAYGSGIYITTPKK